MQQGIEEGAFTVEHPAEMGSIVFQTMYFMSETLAKLLINQKNNQPWADVENKITSYNSALDSLLNAEPGSIQLFEFEPFEHWFKEN